MGNTYESADFTYSGHFTGLGILGCVLGVWFPVFGKVDLPRSRNFGTVSADREDYSRTSGGFVDNQQAKAVEMCPVLCFTGSGTLAEKKGTSFQLTFGRSHDRVTCAGSLKMQ